MTFRLGRLATAVGITIALVSCGAPPTAPPTGSGSSAAESKYQKYEALKGQERRDQLVKDAKAEGELSLYTSMTSDVADGRRPRRSPTSSASRSTCTAPHRKPFFSASCRSPAPTMPAPTWSRPMHSRWPRSARRS